MKNLWAPWRMKFIKNTRTKKNKCIFCVLPKEKNDMKNFILYRGKKNFVIMNIYPYNNSHLMVSTYKHMKNLINMKDDELIEHFKLVRKLTKIIKKIFKSEGFNIGINIGKISGAGFNHLHTHIVPRWKGDNNFMPVLSETKVLPELLETTYKKIKKELELINFK